MNLENQRLRFGGFNWSGAFFGWLVATAVTALLVGLIGAAGGAVALTRGVSTLGANLPTVGIASAVAMLVALAVAYYAGGYVAGRMARFDGGRQGFGVWLMGLVITLVLGLAGAILGSSYNLLQAMNVPHIPVNQGALTTGGLVTLLLALVVSLVAAMAGAKSGEQYHRRVDEAGMVPAAPAARERVRETAREVEDEREDREERFQGPARRPAVTFGERIEPRGRRK